MYKALIFATFFLNLSLSLIFPSQINAQFETPENLDIKLSGMSVVNNTLISKLEIDNPSSTTLKNVYYTATLTTNGASTRQTVEGQVEVATASGLLVNYSDSEPFTLEASSKTDQEIRLPFNETIPSGMYYLSVQLKDQNTQPLRFTTTEAFLNGQGRYLSIDTNSCVLKVNNKSFPPNQGALVKPNSAPTAECTITNPGTTPITVRAKVDYSERFVVGFQKDVHEYSPKETITFNPGQTRTVSTILPSITKPQVYDGLLYFIDSNSSEISIMTGFRWTIEGPSARIDYVNLDKEYYTQGSTAQVEVKALSSMDLYWRQGTGQGQGFSPQAGTDLINPKMVARITTDGAECGVGQVDLPPTTEGSVWPVQKLSVPISQNCPNPKVEVEIKEGDQILTKGEKVYQSPPTGLTSLVGKNSLNYLIAGIVLILIIVGVGFIIYRKRKSPPSHPSNTAGPVSQTVKTVVMIVVMVGISAAVIKQFDLIEKVSQDMTVLAQFSGRSVRVSGQYGQTGPNGGVIDFWGIVSDFSQNGGQSQITVPIDCSIPPRVTLYGYTGASYACENAPSHLIYNYFLDGQPINIASATSPDSQVIASGNRLQLRSSTWNAYGPKTGTVNFQGGQLSYSTHTFRADFYVEGGYDQQARSNTGSINVQFTCKEPCPNPGETNPHGTCDGKSCIQVNSCGVTTCGTNVDCGGCLPGEQQPHLACVNQSCQQVDACGTNTCANDQDCCPAGQITPHLTCINQSCQPVNACGASTCATNNDCCPAGQTSPHQECEGTNCTTVDSCGPPIVCTKPGETVPHGVCDGVSCRQVNTCGVTSCTEDKQCYSDDMCKCDGFNAINLKNPGTSQFEFESFAKVLTENASKAKVESIEFLMTKTSKSSADQTGGVLLAQSGKLTPTLVSSTDGGVRFRAAWKVNPPAYDPNATYRVFSKIKCAPKAASSSASLDEMLALATNRVYSSDNSNILGEELNYSSVKLVQNNYLELDTLEDSFYTRVLEADACSAIRFEYGQY